jgi:LAO/AO transport system kinase
MPAPDAKELARAVLRGDRRALAQAITLIESTRAEDRKAALALLADLVPRAGNSIRVGISGVPGVGKSTFIEGLGNYLIDQGHRVAVLAVDPSSAVSGGSILGDKTRMEQLSRRPEAFIRPSPSGATLGGVTRRTREAMLAVEAAGFDVVLVETVGVGQSENAVAGMTDIFILMLLPGGGDELQGIKRGIVELADLILINKADGALQHAAEVSVNDYRNALHFLRPRTERWQVRVEPYSALEGSRTPAIWDIVLQYQRALSTADEIDRNRVEQSKAWMWEEVASALVDALRNDSEVKTRVRELEAKVTAGELSPTAAAQELINVFFEGGKSGRP